MYALNSTLYCVRVCPVSYYPSNDTRSCMPCTSGCINCTNATFCHQCSSTYLFSDNQCIGTCSPTLPYFYGSTCLSACIDGTYLLSDDVTCANCSAKCSTCSISPLNCTKCVGAFLYNYNCVTKCPNNYYANIDLLCVPCTSTTPQCSV